MCTSASVYVYVHVHITAHTSITPSPPSLHCDVGQSVDYVVLTWRRGQGYFHIYINFRIRSYMCACVNMKSRTSLRS